MAESLYSYNLKIAEWTTSGMIVYDFTATGNAFRSMTTSQHVGLIKREVKSSSIMLPEAARHAGLIDKRTFSVLDFSFTVIHYYITQNNGGHHDR